MFGFVIINNISSLWYVTSSVYLSKTHISALQVIFNKCINHISILSPEFPEHLDENRFTVS